MHVFSLKLIPPKNLAQPSQNLRIVLKNARMFVERETLDKLEASSWNDHVTTDVREAAFMLLALFLIDHRPSAVHGPDGIYRTTIGEIRIHEDPHMISGSRFEYVLALT